MPHLGVTTFAGVGPDSIRQGDYLLQGFEHLRAYETVAPGAAGRTSGVALERIDLTTRTDYEVGSGCHVALLFHHIPLGLPCLRLLAETLFLKRFSLERFPCWFTFHRVGNYVYAG